VFGGTFQPFRQPNQRRGSHQPRGCGASERHVDEIGVSANPPVPTLFCFVTTSFLLSFSTIYPTNFFRPRGVGGVFGGTF
jgi:hypothetical protein